MNSDNPFSSGPGKSAPKTGASQPDGVTVPETIEEEVVASAEPARSVANVRPAAASESGELPPLEMEETSCRTCQFFHFDGETRVAAAEGECRYNAPTPGLDERAQWPVVDWNSWCGQWNTGISNDDMVKMARIVADRMTDPGSLTD